MAAVQQQWKDNPIASINIISPNTDQAKIELRALRAESVAHRNVYATLNYNGVTGQDETDKNIRIKNPIDSKWPSITWSPSYTKRVASTSAALVIILLRYFRYAHGGYGSYPLCV